MSDHDVTGIEREPVCDRCWEPVDQDNDGRWTHTSAVQRLGIDLAAPGMADAFDVHFMTTTGRRVGAVFSPSGDPALLTVTPTERTDELLTLHGLGPSRFIGPGDTITIPRYGNITS
jgi:hypothetical protein